MRCSLEFFGGIYVRCEGEEDKQTFLVQITACLYDHVLADRCLCGLDLDRSLCQYQRKTISTAAGEREVAVAGTYEQVDKNYTDSETGETINLGQDIFAVLQAPTKGIQELPTSLRSSY